MMIEIIIDTREQRPWGFAPAVVIDNQVVQLITKIDTIKSGDYALKDDKNFAIERKSADDFAGTISSGYARFCRELKRMDDAQFVAKVIIVESDFETFCFHTSQGEIIPPNHEHIMITPQFVMKRIAQLTLQNVSVIFARDPELSSAIAQTILVERYLQIQKGIENDK